MVFKKQGIDTEAEEEINRQLIACPFRDEHTECPGGYVNWHNWADEMRKTHNQYQCDGCGLWAIWKPK